MNDLLSASSILKTCSKLLVIWAAAVSLMENVKAAMGTRPMA